MEPFIGIRRLKVRLETDCQAIKKKNETAGAVQNEI
jgi:hypothetical protein